MLLMASERTIPSPIPIPILSLLILPCVYCTVYIRLLCPFVSHVVPPINYVNVLLSPSPWRNYKLHYTKGHSLEFLHAASRGILGVFHATTLGHYCATFPSSCLLHLLPSSYRTPTCIFTQETQTTQPHKRSSSIAYIYTKNTRSHLSAAEEVSTVIDNPTSFIMKVNHSIRFHQIHRFLYRVTNHTLYSMRVEVQSVPTFS